MTNVTFRSNRGSIILGVSAAALLNLPSHADFTWDGGAADDFWQTDANWVGDVAPDIDLDSMLLIFGPTGAAQDADAQADDYRNVGGIRFTGADAELRLLGTGSLSFVDEAAIINDSAFTQTIAIDLFGNGDTLIIDAMTGDFEISGDIDISESQGVQLIIRGDNDTLLSGIISGQGGSLLKEDAGTLTLSGANTFNGGVELSEGAIVLGHDDALGTRTLTVTGDASLQSNDDDRRITNQIELDDDVTLTLSGASDLALAGRISGDGGLEIDGDADDVVFTLAVRNTYVGDTILRNGTLHIGANRALGDGELSIRGDGGAIRSGSNDLILQNAVDIRSGANLTFTGRNNLTITNVVSGLGSITIDTQSASARLTLSSANTYEGGTIINRGTVALGSDTALGTGDLELTGTATLRSTSDLRTIENRIRLGDNLLRVRGDFSLTVDANISGAGGLEIDFADATKRLILLRENTFTGLTSVNAGILQLDGSIGGDAEVQDEGRLIGEGAIGGDLVVGDDGEVSPGLSVGTLTVEGDFELENDGVYVAEIDTVEDESDLIDVEGAAFLRDGSRIEASVSGTTFAPSGATYTIIRADGGITDEGAEIITDSATLTFSLIRAQDFMDGDMIFALEVFREDDAYSSAADAGNNFAIGQSLDSLLPIASDDPAGDAAGLLGALDALDEDSFNTALNELSPEPYNTAVTLSTESAKLYNLQLSRYLATRRSAIANFRELAAATMPRPGSLAMAGNDPALLAAAIAQMEETDVDELNGDAEENGDAGYSVFGQFYGSFFDLDSDGNRTGFDGTLFGGNAGIDWEVGSNSILGVAAGYTYGDADWDNDRGSIQDHALRAGPYFSLTNGPWYLDASVTFGYHFYEADRNLTTLGRVVKSDFNGWDVTGYAAGGYEWELRNNLFLTPNAAVQYSYFSFDSFSEEDAGGANLDVDSRDADSLRTRLGLDLSAKVDVGPVIMPSVYGGWESEWSDDTDDVEAGFAAGGIPFAVDTGPREGDSFYIGFGVSVLFHRDVAGFLRFEKAFGDDIDGAGVAGGLTFNF